MGSQRMRHMWLDHFGALGVKLKQKLTDEQVAQEILEKAKAQEQLCTEQQHDALLALEVIQKTLVSSIDGFTQTMQDISLFYIGLQQEVGDFLRRQEEANNLEKKEREMAEAAL